jgi:hypothetical protein
MSKESIVLAGLSDAELKSAIDLVNGKMIEVDKTPSAGISGGTCASNLENKSNKESKELIR